MPADYAIFKDGHLISGKIDEKDVPKYIADIHMLREQGEHEFAEMVLNSLLNQDEPLAIVVKARDLLNAKKIDEAHKLITQALITDDTDVLVNYATWVLDGVFEQDDIDGALEMMRKVASRGFPHLTIAAPGYFLKQIVLGGDHGTNNQQLRDWLEIWNPEACRQHEQGKLSHDDLLAPVAQAAGLFRTGL